MYHTWFFQKRLAEALNSEITGLQLLACFSQQKDELILSFGDQHREVHIRADMGSQAGILSFRDSFSRARKNSVDLFEELVDKRITSVFSFTHERSFSIKMEDGFQLIFKMHGNRSNVLLIENDAVIRIFRNNLPADKGLSPAKLQNEMEIDNSTILKLLGKKNLHLFTDQQKDASEFLDQLNLNPIYVGMINSQPYLSLTETEHPKQITTNAIEASTAFADLYHRHFQLTKEKKQIEQVISKQTKQSENYVKKTARKLDEIISERSLGEIADILMANLHSLKAGEKKVTLDDIYNGGSIGIKLNPNLSPQKNAENYYRKSKNKKVEIENLEKNILSKQNESKQLQDLFDDLHKIDNLKELRVFNATHFGKTSKQNEVPVPYHKFIIDGFEVLIGKNAKSNDILTQKIASKNDLWLHARDVAGSHVVIREKPGYKFPAPVIEKVAALAAWYSKRRTDSLCPVIYTPKKFVRKLKGAPSGQVVVEKEEVIMVVPTNKLH
ncbi:MAG: DUF814 domain-containing protein [Cytophagales bacterium]|nr:DUF814 domain-containing protein [Cytophagales bacterium]